MAGDDVSWAVSSAWAPCIATKGGKYYFYFCAKDVFGDSHIGVAVADSPVGPFRAMQEPLLTKKMCEEHGIMMWQTIDPSVFTDEDGASYLLFGNGHAAVVRLMDDMVSLDLSTLTQYLGAEDFREAVTVTKRGGIYHFTWSSCPSQAISIILFITVFTRRLGCFARDLGSIGKSVSTSCVLMQKPDGCCR